MVRRLVRMFSARPTQIQSYQCLLCKVVPQLQRPLAVCTTKATDDVVFKSLYCPSRCVYSVILGFDELPFAFFCFQKCLQRLRCLVVRHIQQRPVAVLLNLVEYLLYYYLNNFLILEFTDFLCLDKIVVIIICDYSWVGHQKRTH